MASPAWAAAELYGEGRWGYQVEEAPPDELYREDHADKGRRQESDSERARADRGELLGEVALVDLELEATLDDQSCTQVGSRVDPGGCIY